MGVEEVVEVFSTVLPGLSTKRDDDFVDRLSSRYTVTMLLVFASIVGFYQLTGRPIVCWAPVHFTGSHINYANNYCWVRNTYYLPWQQRIPLTDEVGRQMVVYYQWIPIILLVQAILFFLPSVVWHGLNNKAGVDSDNILATALSLNETQKEEQREKVMFLVTRQIDRFLGSRLEHGMGWRGNLKKMLTVCCRLCGRRFGNYLVAVWVFTKILYICNALLQMYILNYLLGTHYSTFGLEVLKGMAPDHEWQNTPYTAFPRVTFCDFNVRRLANIQRYTLQCTLPLNVWNEKIYTFLWFWLVFIIIASILGLLQWLVRFFWRQDRVRFIKNHLRGTGRLQKNHGRVDEFVDSYLRQDGAFVLRLIAHNTNHVSTTDIICSVWDFWLEKPKKTAKDAMLAYHDDDDENVE